MVGADADAATEAAARPVPPAESARTPRWFTLGVGVATLVAAVLVVVRPTKSFWQDEAYTWSTATLPGLTFWRHLVTSEIGGAFHLAIEHGWTWFGTGETWMRIPSMVVGVVLVPVAAGLAAHLFGHRAGLIAAFLVACNATVITYAQEARGYALAMLLATVSTWCFALDLARPSRRNRTGWIVSSVLLVFTSPFGALVGVAQGLSLVAKPRAEWNPRRVLAGAAWILAADAIVGALVVMQSNPSTITGPYIWQLRQTFEGLAGAGGILLLIVYFLIAVAGVVTAARVWRACGRSDASWRWVLVIALIAVPPVIMFIASFATPIVIERYLITCLPPLAILVGATLARIQPAALRITAVAVVLVFASVGVYRWHASEGREDWRAVTEYITANSAPGDRVVFAYDDVRIPLEYYGRGNRVLRSNVTPAFPAQAWGGYTVRDFRLVEPTDDELRAAFATGSRVWVVDAHLADPGAFAQRVGEVAGNRPAAVRKTFAGDLHVTRYDAP